MVWVAGINEVDTFFFVIEPVSGLTGVLSLDWHCYFLGTWPHLCYIALKSGHPTGLYVNKKTQSKTKAHQPQANKQKFPLIKPWLSS